MDIKPNGNMHLFTLEIYYSEGNVTHCDENAEESEILQEMIGLTDGTDVFNDNSYSRYYCLSGTFVEEYYTDALFNELSYSLKFE